MNLICVEDGIDSSKEAGKLLMWRRWCYCSEMLQMPKLENVDNSLIFSIEGRPIPIRTHKTYELEELQKMACTYHEKFEKYFNEIIEAIMPDSYLESKMSLVDGVNAVIKMGNVQKNE